MTASPLQRAGKNGLFTSIFLAKINPKRTIFHARSQPAKNAARGTNNKKVTWKLRPRALEWCHRDRAPT
jgi:hypothetical protein